MISHQHPSMKVPSGAPAAFAQGGQPPLAVLVIGTNLWALVTASHDLVHGIGKFNANRSCQVTHKSQSLPRGQQSLSDHYTILGLTLSLS
jgi:hypothetical protein